MHQGQWEQKRLVREGEGAGPPEGHAAAHSLRLKITVLTQPELGSVSRQRGSGLQGPPRTPAAEGESNRRDSAFRVFPAFGMQLGCLGRETLWGQKTAGPAVTVTWKATASQCPVGWTGAPHTVLQVSGPHAESLHPLLRAGGSQCVQVCKCVYVS